MPWSTIQVNELVFQSKQLLAQHFDNNFDAAVFLCTQEELTRRLETEFATQNLTIKELKYYRSVIFPQVIGRYFRKTREIWLIDGKGDNLAPLTHEFLHTIQHCWPHREGIVDFITYKLTNDSRFIDPYTRENWREIEKNREFATIKKRLLIEGDCEDI